MSRCTDSLSYAGRFDEDMEKEKRTIVFVTNNIEEALYLADRIIVFDKLSRPESEDI